MRMWQLKVSQKSYGMLGDTAHKDVAINDIGGGGTPHIFYHIMWGGDTAHIMCTNIRIWQLKIKGGHRTYFIIIQGGGTPHILCVQ